jgi:hypothetical protein
MQGFLSTKQKRYQKLAFPNFFYRCSRSVEGSGNTEVFHELRRFRLRWHLLEIGILISQPP